jgi:hypothetical protein
MDTITVPSSLISIQTKEPISPAMRAVIWEIGSALDEARVKVGHRDPVWLSIPTKRLRGEHARNDNAHLKMTLDRLAGIYLTGEHKGDEWGAVLLAEWHLEQGGSMARLFIPPAAVAAIQSPRTFARIESRAAHSLTGHGRQLYILLADKKNMNQQHWTFTVDELRSLMGCEDKKAYKVWHQFNRWVLQPALDQVNDFGTVSVKMTAKRLGRAVQWIRFDWHWKDPHEAMKTTVENARHSAARRKTQETADAPPIIEDTPKGDSVRTWWNSLTGAERQAWGDRAGRTFEAGGLQITRNERDLARAAYEIFITRPSRSGQNMETHDTVHLERYKTP